MQLLFLPVSRNSSFSKKATQVTQRLLIECGNWTPRPAPAARPPLRKLSAPHGVRCVVRRVNWPAYVSRVTGATTPTNSFYIWTLQCILYTYENSTHYRLTSCGRRCFRCGGLSTGSLEMNHFVFCGRDINLVRTRYRLSLKYHKRGKGRHTK